MSSLVFPTLPGLTFPVVRTYEWDTEVQQALSGKRSTLANRQYPLVHFEQPFSLLRDNISVSELKQIVGLHNAMHGRYDTFLYTDPDFNTVTGQQFGTGDGTQTAFQVTATFQNSGGPGQAEIIQNFNGAPSIYVNGVLQTSGYTNSNGIITFAGAPANTYALTWTGSFYYRCAFDEDKLDLSKFMNKYWEIKKLPFTSVKL